MRDRARKTETELDDVSAHLGEVLRRADQLLAEWSRFGDGVRAQVEREAATIATTVAGAIDGATVRGVAASVDAAVADRLNAFAAEVGRLEVRCRAIARERSRDRRALWAIVAGVIVANALLAVMLLRPSEPVVTPPPELVPTPVIVPLPLVVPVAAPPPAPEPPKKPVQAKTLGAPGKRG